MILLADEVEFRPRRLMTLEAIEPQKVVNFLRSVADNFRAILVGVEAKNSQSFVFGLNPFCCLTIASLGISCSTVPSGNSPLPAWATATVPFRLSAKLPTKKCFTEVIFVMHWNVDPSTLYFGSLACALPTHNRSAAKHETLPVSAKMFMRLCFIDFLPVWFDIAARALRFPRSGE